MALAALSAACNRSSSLGAVPLTHASHHTLAPAIQAFCAAMITIECAIPEYTDDQRLMGEQKDKYGPYAWTGPAKNLGTFNADTDFQGAAAKLVSVVYVDPGALPSTYSDLRLTNGFHCIYLLHNGSIFGAFVKPAPGPTTPCTDTYTPSGPESPLAVAAVVPPTTFGGATNIPPVARFHEGTKGQSNGNPLLGVRCGDKWCRVLPPGGDTLDLPHKNEHVTKKTWEVHGWHDVQQIAEKNAAGGLSRGTLKASAIPHENLATITDAMFRADFQHVATVRFWNKPRGKYDTDWHFRKGENQIWIKRLTDTQWVTEVRNSFRIGPITIINYRHQVYTTWRQRSEMPPAIVRFQWSETDENLWVACRDGCCDVSAT